MPVKKIKKGAKFMRAVQRIPLMYDGKDL